MLIGVHCSISGGLVNAPLEAQSLSCSTYQIFTRSSRSWKTPELKSEQVELFKRKNKELGFSNLVTHLPYLPNFANPDKEIYSNSQHNLIEEAKRCDILEVSNLVVHIGSHKGLGSKKGILTVQSHLEKFIQSEFKVNICLEISAGSKNSVGSTIEELQQIRDGLSETSQIKICLDTAHAFASGYDFRNKEAVDTFTDEFESLIGFKNLAVIHVNDSKVDVGGKVDRHEHLGKGYIGMQGLQNLLRHKKIVDLPIPRILETPRDTKEADKINLKILSEIVNGPWQI